MVIQPQHGQNIHQKRCPKFGKNSPQKGPKKGSTLCKITIFAENDFFFENKTSLFREYVTGKLAFLKHIKVFFDGAKVVQTFFTPGMTA